MMYSELDFVSAVRRSSGSPCMAPYLTVRHPQGIRFLPYAAMCFEYEAAPLEQGLLHVQLCIAHWIDYVMRLKDINPYYRAASAKIYDEITRAMQWDPKELANRIKDLDIF